MFKRCGKGTNECLNNKNNNLKVNSTQTDNNNILEIIVGSSNVKRWNRIKKALFCTSDEDFVTKLLDLAQKYYQVDNEKQLNEKPENSLQCKNRVKENSTPSSENSENMVESKRRNTKKTTDGIKLKKNKENKSKSANEEKSFENVYENATLNEINNFLSEYSERDMCNKTESQNLIELQENFIDSGSINKVGDSLELTDVKNNTNLVDNFKKKRKPTGDVKVTSKKEDIIEKTARSKRSSKKKKKPVSYDIRKAPELQEQIEEIVGLNTSKQLLSSSEIENETGNEKLTSKVKLCCDCDTHHFQNNCPLAHPHSQMFDSITHEEWLAKSGNFPNNQATDMDLLNISDKSIDEQYLKASYANLSLPKVLWLIDSNTPHGMSVFANCEINQFTQFGPLVGKTVKEVDIPEDFPMRELWMIFEKDSYTYVRTDYLNHTNWFRYLRPAPTREQRNAAAICKNNKLFLITIKTILSGEEMLFWQDDNLNLNKKKMSKTSCGGCNMFFTHPLYYRTHCTIFHDIRYSLTIRKYHCKVCGAAVLGKENIMKHAAELHNGQGAYQCQFCKKFFLRLNYLEMHRTYGCSANPHRSRPLCDFCGKKFCQPQKLKIHIKRMHNDISEVLKEFQCKNCLKVLGSRAALQRHMKEVHNKQVEGACACYRCGKLFQNKSNLKIHMLTHSGIKPFRCKEDKCNAAFTTKQCLQFHYKKVHGFTDDAMPKIERSIDYTFEAYSGMEDQIQTENKNQKINIATFDCDDENDNESIDAQNVDDPDPVKLETSLNNEQVPTLSQTPPQPETNFTMKILSKGSKKWLGEQLDSLSQSNLDHNQLKASDKSQFVCSEPQTPSFDVSKTTLNLNTFGRHESSNASLLVEAALGSVADINCTDSNIDIDVSGTPNATDALVSNICNLSHSDELPDVSYSNSVDVNEHRNIGLISPSVNDNISVTDDLNTDLHNSENIGIDYSSFQEGDFSTNNSPENEAQSDFHCDYTSANQIASQEDNNYDTDQSKNLSPGSSPPRYNFGHEVTINHVSPNDANCITAQNLSLHNSKGEQLDLSIYKSSYGLDPSNFQLRKDFRMKLSLEPEHKQLYVLEVEDVSRNLNKNIFNEENKYSLFSTESTQVEVVDSKDIENKTADENTSDDKYTNSEFDTSFRSKYADSELETRSKQLEFDLNFRSKSYDLAGDLLQIRNTYENTLDIDFRNKSYPGIDNSDIRNKTYEGIDTELRTDRNFDSLVFTPTELQGIDMTARSFHNYHASNAAASLNRYHHLYSDVERASIDLRVNYSPPPPTYSHADVLRVVSLDLTSPGRHTVDLSLRNNPLHAHQISNSRLLSEHSLQSSRILSEPGRLTLDQNRLLSTDLSTSRHLESHSRLLNVSESNGRVLSDHSTNRLLSNDQNESTHFGTTEQSRIMADDSRFINDQSRLIEQGRLLSDVRILPSGSLSPIPYPNYSVSPTPYHPPVLTARSHVTSPTPSPYHHYSSYY